MLLDDLITKEANDEKCNDLVIDLQKSIDKRTIVENTISEQINIRKLNNSSKIIFKWRNIKCR